MLKRTNNGLEVFESTDINRFPVPEHALTVDFMGQSQAAADLMVGTLVRRTGLVNSAALSNEGQVRIKDETVHRGSSFKTRNAINGAVHYVRQGDHQFITASAGSFGIGLAEALSHWGHDLEVVVPACTNQAKTHAIESLGADVVVHGETVDEALSHAVERAKQTSARFVHPFANIYSIAGASTIAWELLEDAPNMTHVVLPFGGGSIAAGVGTVIKQLRPDVEVVVAQVAKNTAFVDSVLTGVPQTSNDLDTRFGGIAVKSTHPLTLGLGSQAVDRVLKLPARYIYETLHNLKPRDELGKVLEEAGVCSPAGARFLAEQTDNRGAEIVAIATGANPGPVVNSYSKAIAQRLQRS